MRMAVPWRSMPGRTDDIRFRDSVNSGNLLHPERQSPTFMIADLSYRAIPWRKNWSIRDFIQTQPGTRPQRVSKGKSKYRCLKFERVQHIRNRLEPGRRKKKTRRWPGISENRNIHAADHSLSTISSRIFRGTQKIAR